MLTVKTVHTYYGSIHALKGVSLHVRAGEMVTLIGANGAGKSTLVNTICGLVKPQKGKIEFEGKAVDRLSPEAIVRLGIALVPGRAAGLLHPDGGSESGNGSLHSPAQW